MSTSATMPGFVRRLTGWWRAWAQQRATLDSLQRMGRDDVERLARDVAISSDDLCTLAGKWPDSADLLSRRLALLGLSEEKLERSEPQALRDLQRGCSLCSDKQRCEHDLAAADSSDQAWTDYCPNAQTLEALDAERKKRGERADDTHTERN